MKSMADHKILDQVRKQCKLQVWMKEQLTPEGITTDINVTEMADYNSLLCRSLLLSRDQLDQLNQQLRKQKQKLNTVKFEKIWLKKLDSKAEELKDITIAAGDLTVGDVAWQPRIGGRVSVFFKKIYHSSTAVVLLLPCLIFYFNWISRQWRLS